MDDWYKPYCDQIEILNQKSDIWFSYDPIDSYQALMNWIIGARGDGKTFGFKIKAIRHFMKTGRQSVYLRRTEGELREAMSKFLNDISDKFYPYKFRIQKKELQIIEYDEDAGECIGEWETILHFAYLANSVKYKSVSYDKVDLICYDEVIIKETKDIRYLDDEVDTFLHFYETVARLRDVTVYFLSNAITVHNPYFYFWDMKLPNTKSRIKRLRDDIVIQVAKDEEYKKVKKQTRFGQLIAGTEFEKTSIDNEFILDTVEQIKRKSKNAHYWKTLCIGKTFWGVYADTSLADIEFYISENVNYNSITVKIPDKGAIKKSNYRAGDIKFMNMIRKALDFDRLFFETDKCKNVVGLMLMRWH